MDDTHCPQILTRPGQSQCRRQDCRSDNDAHHEIQVAHRNAGVEETNGKRGDKDSVAHHETVAHPDEARAARIGLEVRAVSASLSAEWSRRSEHTGPGDVQIICADGRHRNQLGRCSRGDSHEDDEQCGNRSAFPEQSHGSVGKHEACRYVVGRHAVWERWESRILHA